MNKIEDKYDVVIIGAGIGGLVCGSYLAKAGMNTLIVEQRMKVGGYCSSFKRKGYTFDVGVHYLGGFREGGQLKKVYDDLKLWKYCEILRVNPSDILLMPNCKIAIKNDLEETIEEFQTNFPKQKESIKNFFYYIVKTPAINLYVDLKNKTFSDLLKKYFNDEEITAVLNVLLGNIGLSSDLASALKTALVFREDILDGGYYPKGGMQSFPDALAAAFKAEGGTISCSTKVKKIVLDNNRAIGVQLNSNSCIKAKYIISNVDCRETFLDLIDRESIDSKFMTTLLELEPSVSAFLVYLGLKKSYKNIVEKTCNVWYFPHYKANSVYLSAVKGILNLDDKYIICSFPSFCDPSLAPPNRESICLTILVPYKSEKFWKTNKEKIVANLLLRFKNIVGDISSFIDVNLIATPITLNKYTSNYKGAMYGWASSVGQSSSKLVPQKDIYVKNLFLTGHWTTHETGQGGIPMVVHSGRKTAELILKKHKTKSIYFINK